MSIHETAKKLSTEMDEAEKSGVNMLVFAFEGDGIWTAASADGLQLLNAVAEIAKQMVLRGTSVEALLNSVTVGAAEALKENSGRYALSADGCTVTPVEEEKWEEIFDENETVH